MCKFVLVGKAASGKDYCQKVFVERGYKPLKQYTTRPKRPNETGDEYHFISKKRMEKMIEEKKFISVKEFKGWYYGFTLDELEKCDVAILNVGNINDLATWYPNVLRMTTIIFIDTSLEVRRHRLSSRYSGGNEDDSLERRLEADERDFKNFHYYDLKFGSSEELVHFINKITPLNNRSGKNNKKG